MNVKRMCTLAVSVSLAMVLSFLESLIPPLSAVPGVKLGLSNTVGLFLLYTLGIPAAIAVTLVRVVLSSLLFGSPVSMLYSLSGAVLSLAVMIGFKYLPLFSEIGVSIIGGVFHNIGQVLMAMLIMKSAAIAVYLPPLLISGVIAGALVGLLAGILVSKLRDKLKLEPLIKARHKPLPSGEEKESTSVPSESE